MFLCKTNCHIAQAGLEHYPPVSASASMQLFDSGSHSCPLPFLQGLVPALAWPQTRIFLITSTTAAPSLPTQPVYLADDSASGNVVKCGDMVNSYIPLGLIF